MPSTRKAAYVVVVKYPLSATSELRIASLSSGLAEVACQLVACGYTLSELEDALGNAQAAAENHWDELNRSER